MIQNAEFLFEGGRAGVLLIHGLTGTPNEMRLLGKGLHKAGFTVHGMQLAGHCGDEQDLAATGWQDWYRSVEVAAEQLRQRVDHLFVGGLSMGAVLALKLAADRPELVAGVGVYGPTFRYDGWSIPLYARHLNFLLRWFKRFNLFQDRYFVEQPPYGLKDERLRATVSNSMLSGDSVAAGLAGNPYPALADMMTLSARVRRQLSQVTAPCLIMHAAEDDIADIRNSLLVKRRVRGPVHMVVLNDSYHMITIDRERKEVVKESVAMFQSVVRERLALAGEHQSASDVFAVAETGVLS
ncbi:MAG TPA: alpha/beta fold hydrolase [Moraxellaceae bacterium]|nr:alpha/beta fold hydrolase [Moraxellaceae bacterium]